MKIEKLYIESFGCLKNFSLSFEPGLNTVYGINENGKSTIMAFIKMMFYGSEQRKSADITKSLRKKYTPWDKSKMSGSINFVFNSRHYRIEREFGASNSTDRVVLCDLDMGTRDTVGSDIGQKFFGLTSQAFERSSFIGQLGYLKTDDLTASEINTKLSNICSSGDEDISYQQVLERLEKAEYDLISKSGRTGKLVENKNVLEQLNNKLSDSKLKEDFNVKKQNELNEQIIKINKYKNKLQNLKTILDKEQYIRNLPKMQKMLELKSQLDTINEKLKLSDGNLADDDYVRKLTFCVSSIDRIQERINIKREEELSLKKSLEIFENPQSNVSQEKVDAITTSINELEQNNALLKQNYENANSKLTECTSNLEKLSNSKSHINVLFLVPAILLVIFTVIIFVFSKAITPAIISAGIGLLLGILSFVIMPKGKKVKEQLENQKSEYKNLKLDLQKSISTNNISISQMNDQLITMKNFINNNATNISHQQTLLAECIKQISEDTLNKDNQTEKLRDLLLKYDNSFNIKDAKSKIVAISANAQSQKEIKQQLSYIVKDLNNITYEQAKDMILHSDNITISEDELSHTHAQYDELNNEYLTLKEDYVRSESEFKAFQKTRTDPKTINLKISKLVEKISFQQKYYDAVKIANNILTESFAQLRGQYGCTLETKSTDIFNKLTRGRYKEMSVSKTFDINVSPANSFGSHEIGYLSSGTTDQAYLSLRLALTEMLSNNGEQIPVMLDDVLCQYDDERTNDALKFLYDYSSNIQIILFTCHGNVKKFSESLNANTLTLNNME